VLDVLCRLWLWRCWLRRPFPCSCRVSARSDTVSSSSHQRDSIASVRVQGRAGRDFFYHRLSPRTSSDCCPEGRSSFLHPARFPAWVGILQPRGHSPCSEAVPRCSRYQPLVLALESHNTSQCVTFTQHAPLRRALQSRCWRESSSVSLFGLTNLVSPGSFSPQI